jgi:MoaA/NifB/PqqE/SkfB family radical SAM enzyme
METEHEFTLVLEGISEFTTEVMDALFEAGCDDATVSRQFGRVSMDFGRSAPTMKDAVISAIRDVQKANIGATVVRVEGFEPSSMQETDGEILRLIGA